MQTCCHIITFSESKNEAMERIASQKNTEEAFSKSGIDNRC